MSDRNFLLDVVATVDRARPLERLIDGYAAEIEARRHQLHSDLELYCGKLADLAELDPADATGLGLLYRAHVRHIEALLDEFA